MYPGFHEWVGGLTRFELPWFMSPEIVKDNALVIIYIAGVI